MTHRRAPLLLRLWAVILLALIGWQALEPVPAPLQRVSGSAFSAATADVAVVSARRSEAVRAQVLPTPALPVWVTSVALPPIARDVAQPEHLRPGARGPPPRETAERLPDTRGPPLA